VKPLLLPFSAAFRAGVALRHSAYRYGWFKVRHLRRPVVSVGNLTVGGTGKTPLVACIARILLRNGLKPSILTRGYGRSSKAAMIVIEPGASRPDPREVGDEPAILARLLPEIPVMICADRYHAGQAAEERFGIDVHILDDGFQHLALARDLDLLALDSTQPISDWDLLPAGRQREPVSALRRAQFVVLTRADTTDPSPLEELLLELHPNAQVFRSRTELLGWTNALTGQAISAGEIQAQKVAAFCAIGNPGAFFGNLRHWGFNLVAEDAFRDHHVYTGEEIRRLVANARKKGAAALLTTQKDAVKFAPDWTPELPLLACQIEAQIIHAASFERALLTCVRRPHS
jgi:tetraacyldisaccharide 4'-kinase